MAINTYFQNIANAIRTKTGSAGLITPAEMPDEILNIPAGGCLTPLYEDLDGFWVTSDGSSLYAQDSVVNRNDIYLIEKAGHYILFKGGSNNGNRFRAGIFNTNMGTYPLPTSQTLIESGGLAFYSEDSADQNGFSIRFNDNPINNPASVRNITSAYIGKYLTITKNNTGDLNNKIYVLRLEDLIED